MGKLAESSFKKDGEKKRGRGVCLRKVGTEPGRDKREKKRKKGRIKERIERRSERKGDLSLPTPPLSLSLKEWKHNSEGPGRPVPRIRVIDSVMSRTTRARS